MRGEAGQNFLEKVVPLDDIGIALADQCGERLEIGPIQILRPSGGIGEMNGPGIHGDLESPDAGPFQRLEERLAGGEKVLLDGIAQCEKRMSRYFQSRLRLRQFSP